MTCHPGPEDPETADKTAVARSQVEAFRGRRGGRGFHGRGADTVHFLGDAEDWGFRRFILASRASWRRRPAGSMPS